MCSTPSLVIFLQVTLTLYIFPLKSFQIQITCFFWAGKKCHKAICITYLTSKEQHSLMHVHFTLFFYHDWVSLYFYLNLSRPVDDLLEITYRHRHRPPTAPWYLSYPGVNNFWPTFSSLSLCFFQLGIILFSLSFYTVHMYTSFINKKKLCNRTPNKWGNEYLQSS